MSVPFELISLHIITDSAIEMWKMETFPLYILKSKHRILNKYIRNRLTLYPENHCSENLMHILTMFLWVKSHIHYCRQMHPFCLLLLYCCSSQGLLSKLPCDSQHIVPAFKRDDFLLYCILCITVKLPFLIALII